MLNPEQSRFWQAAIRSQLLDAESLKACWNAIPQAKRDAPEHLDRRLAQKALDARLLTLWQARHLLAGRTKGFKHDRYVLLDLISEGGMGRVFLAKDTRLKRQVALKLLSPARLNNPRAIARFQREALVGAQLKHENLVHIYDFGESRGRYFLVMEYIEGTTVWAEIVEKGPMAPATAVRIASQVAQGLEHLHRRGLIHRDVNPRNILLASDGSAKLADLGLAIDLEVHDRVTREGSTVGTFDYMSPEQTRDARAADIRSDIYSLGCTLYQMISGELPFAGASLPEKLIAQKTMDPTPLDKLLPGLSRELAGIVARMLRRNPDERYATSALVAEALKQFEDPSQCLEDLTRQSSESATCPGAPDRDTASSDHAFSVYATLSTDLPSSERRFGRNSPLAVDVSTATGSATTSKTSVPDTVTSASEDSARTPRWFSIWWRRLALRCLPERIGSDTGRGR
jgi:serine/threonine-protein kinase